MNTFLKEHLILGGAVDQYRGLYEKTIAAAKKHLFFRPLVPDDHDILVSGSLSASATGKLSFVPEGQHLTCFVGGMIAIGAKVFDRPEELHIARKLVDGCIWGYTSTPSGIMPEAFHLASCSDLDECKWDEDTWHDALDAENHYRRGLRGAQIAEQDRLPEGYTSIIDRRYLLRPEVIESVFILYRITGDPELQDAAWHMFTAIHNATLTDTGYSAIADVTALPGKEAGKLDSCESFWFAETLKYFYLIFSDPHLVSLDEYVLNTEAHPLRRPQNSG